MVLPLHNAFPAARSKTVMSYHDRIQKALNFIDKHLTENVQLKDVAKASHFSPYHFHRIFRMMMRETLNEYVSRRRLEYCANLLLYVPEYSVTDIAIFSNYSSIANFSKAFKKHFGITPSQFRNPDATSHIQSQDDSVKSLKDVNHINFNLGNNKTKWLSLENSRLNRQYGLYLDVQNLYPNWEQVEVIPDVAIALEKINIITVTEFDVVYLRSAKGYVIESIMDVWVELKGWLTTHDISLSDVDLSYFGICNDNVFVTPLAQCRYDAAYQLNLLQEDKREYLLKKISPPFHIKKIPSGQYACVSYKGSVTGLFEVYKHFLGHWLIKNQYYLGFPPLEQNFYFCQETNHIKVKVYFKIVERSSSS